MKIYLAAPLFTDKQKYAINEVVKYLRAEGETVFSPMEFTVENAWDISNQEWAKKVYDHDVEGINDCDVVVAIYEGLNSDTGTAWEIGYAYAKGKDVILLCTDSSAKLSLMDVNCALIASSYDYYQILWGWYKDYKAGKTITAGLVDPTTVTLPWVDPNIQDQS